jgi:hypothetical protein
VSKTHIAAFLKLVRHLRVYMRDQQRTMIDAGGLTVEQQQALTALRDALYDVESLLKPSTKRNQEQAKSDWTNDMLPLRCAANANGALLRHLWIPPRGNCSTAAL